MYFYPIRYVSLVTESNQTFNLQEIISYSAMMLPKTKILVFICISKTHKVSCVFFFFLYH